MIETVLELKCLIIEIAAWAVGLYLAVSLSKELPWGGPVLGSAALLRFLKSYLDERQLLKRTDKDLRERLN
jgi:hypothetical protein